MLWILWLLCLWPSKPAHKHWHTLLPWAWLHAKHTLAKAPLIFSLFNLSVALSLSLPLPLSLSLCHFFSICHFTHTLSSLPSCSLSPVPLPQFVHSDSQVSTIRVSERGRERERFGGWGEGERERAFNVESINQFKCDYVNVLRLIHATGHLEPTLTH